MIESSINSIMKVRYVHEIMHFSMRGKSIRILLFLLAISVLNPLFARYTQTCMVKYETEKGWSEYYTVDVNFLSGKELNEATGSYDYSMYSTYAVIFWGEGQASVIEISTYLGCGSEVKQSCIVRMSLSDIEGVDQQKRKWSICVSKYCY